MEDPVPAAKETTDHLGTLDTENPEQLHRVAHCQLQGSGVDSGCCRGPEKMHSTKAMARAICLVARMERREQVSENISKDA